MQNKVHIPSPMLFGLEMFIPHRHVSKKATTREKKQHADKNIGKVNR